MNDDRPSPVMNNVMVGPLEPQKKRLGDDAPPAKIHQAIQVVVRSGDAWNRNFLQDFEVFWPHKHALHGWSVQIAHGGAHHIVGVLRILGIVERVVQRDQRG